MPRPPLPPPRPSPATVDSRRPKEIPQLPQSIRTLNPERIMDLGPPGVTSIGSGNVQPLEIIVIPHNNEYTDATVRYIKAMQTPGGNWDAFESRRPR